MIKYVPGSWSLGDKVYQSKPLKIILNGAVIPNDPLSKIDYSFMHEWGDCTRIAPEIVEGVIEDVPVSPTLLPECKIEKPVDAELAWKELERACRGF